jgi:hypothetical protein
MAHINYARYVCSHKWYVFYACMKLGGIPLSRALLHDMSKFSREEWSPYVHQFYNPDGSKRSVRDASGAYDPSVQFEAFQKAWKHHWMNNPHHHEFWATANTGSTPLEMPETYVREMICDWYGAGMANGKPDVRGWYQSNLNLRLHPDTRKLVEQTVEEAIQKGLF